MIFLFLAVGIFGTGCSIKTKPCQEEKTQCETTGYAVNTESEMVLETGLSNEIESSAEDYINTMSLEEKVAQLFIVLPEALVPVDCVTEAGDLTYDAFQRYPVGGFIYMENNLVSEEQTKQMLSDIQSISYERLGLPVFTCVDEEGGTVRRIGGNPGFDVACIGDMSDVGNRNNISECRNVGTTMGEYLSALGFNVDFAPVADVWSNPENMVIAKRSFGSDPDMVARMALAVWQGLKEENIVGTIKHFPGQGAAEGDTHEGYAYTNKTIEELKACDLIPFKEAVKKGVEVIMVGHISLPNVIGESTPASLSSAVLDGILRKQMGYDGLVITDAMNMGAIAQNYTSAEAAVLAVEAGADMVLMPADFQSAYEGVLDAIRNGRITSERLDQSVKRVVETKLALR